MGTPYIIRVQAIDHSGIRVHIFLPVPLLLRLSCFGRLTAALYPFGFWPPAAAYVPVRRLAAYGGLCTRLFCTRLAVPEWLPPRKKNNDPTPNIGYQRKHKPCEANGIGWR